MGEQRIVGGQCEFTKMGSPFRRRCQQGGERGLAITQPHRACRANQRGGLLDPGCGLRLRRGGQSPACGGDSQSIVRSPVAGCLIQLRHREPGERGQWCAGGRPGGGQRQHAQRLPAAVRRGRAHGRPGRVRSEHGRGCAQPVDRGCAWPDHRDLRRASADQHGDGGGHDPGLRCERAVAEHEPLLRAGIDRPLE